MNKTSNRFAPEVRDRAVRMVGEHRADYVKGFGRLRTKASSAGTRGPHALVYG
jgi:hypothetical protein